MNLSICERFCQLAEILKFYIQLLTETENVNVRSSSISVVGSLLISISGESFNMWRILSYRRNSQVFYWALDRDWECAQQRRGVTLSFKSNIHCRRPITPRQGSQLDESHLLDFSIQTWDNHMKLKIKNHWKFKKQRVWKGLQMQRSKRQRQV